MGIIWAILEWLLEHWSLLVAAAVLVGAFVLGGWRALAAAFVLVVSILSYRRGRADGRAEIERREEARRQQLQEKYDEIDARPRDPDDAYRRLSDRARNG